MPYYKYFSNRVLTLIQNLLVGAKLSEYHTGYRAFSRRVLLNLPLGENSDDFVFDNQMLAQGVWFGYSIGEISCPARYLRSFIYQILTQRYLRHWCDPNLALVLSTETRFKEP